MVGGEEDESSEGDGMIYFFFFSSLLCGREGKGIVVQNRDVCGRNHVYNPNPTLFDSLVLFFFLSLPDYFRFSVYQVYSSSIIILKSKDYFAPGLFFPQSKSKKSRIKSKKRKRLFKVID